MSEVQIETFRLWYRGIVFVHGIWADGSSFRKLIPTHVMLTIEEVSAVPLFSALPTNNLERLARTSADLHLNSGEFAVHEGGEPALFAVLSGKIEVVKMVDGIERSLGWRGPGAIFGEVPIALGTPFSRGIRLGRQATRYLYYHRTRFSSSDQYFIGRHLKQALLAFASEAPDEAAPDTCSRTT